MIIHRSDLCDFSFHAAMRVLIAVLILFLSTPARAELILGAEVRVTVEDNIVGLQPGGSVSSGAGSGSMSGAVARAGGMGFGGGPGGGTAQTGGQYTGGGSRSPGDISVSAAAELGASTDIGDGLSFFANGFADQTDYQRYSEYDSKSAGAAAGLTARSNDMLSIRIAGFGKVRRYDNDADRNGTGLGGSAGLKQLLTNDLWLRETVEYDTFRADHQDFSYRGITGRFTAGYDLTGDLLVTAGYSSQALHYQDSAATALRMGTASLGTDYDLTNNWSVGLLYERQTTGTGASDLITRNNIFSLAIGWDY